MDYSLNNYNYANLYEYPLHYLYILCALQREKFKMQCEFDYNLSHSYMLRVYSFLNPLFQNELTIKSEDMR